MFDRQYVNRPLKKEKPAPKLPNPDPKRWTVVRSRQIGPNLVLEANYPDCTNYEGNKIMLFRNCTLGHLRQQKILDPHFTNNPDVYAPFARFEPTEDGWQAAIGVAERS